MNDKFTLGSIICKIEVPLSNKSEEIIKFYPWNYTSLEKSLNINKVEFLIDSLSVTFDTIEEALAYLLYTSDAGRKALIKMLQLDD